MKTPTALIVMLFIMSMHSAKAQANNTAPTASPPPSPCEKLYNAKAQAEALTVCQPLAEDGDKVAQYIMGRLYMDGNVVPGNPVKALQWFIQSAEQGYAPSQYEIGSAYLSGTGTGSGNTVKGIEWLTLAANQNFSQAEALLGKKYFDQGEYELARTYSLKAGCKNDLLATQNLVRIYFNSLGVIRSCKNAAWWAKKGASRSNWSLANYRQIISDPQCIPDDAYNPCGG